MILSVLVFAAVGCSKTTYEEPIKINSQFNPDGDYDDYKTWNFVDYGDRQIDVPVLEDAAFRLQLANLIEQAMSDRGFQRVFESSDLNVGYHAAKGLMTGEQLKEWYSDYDWYSPAARGASQKNWEKGSLLLFVFDAKSGQMIWQASADAVIDENLSEKERQKTAERAVKMMLEKMPGGQKQ
jgi:hypothetical protein